MKYLISVVIAVYNEEKLLPACLLSLKQQAYPKESYEVIIVDNNSKDKTFQIAKESGFRVYKYSEIQSCGATRAFGTSHAKGSVIAFTDADIRVPPDWLEKINKTMQPPEIVAIGGRPKTREGNIWVRGYIAFYHIFHFINYVCGIPLLWGFTMAIKKNAYDAVGGIDKTMFSAEDWDLGFRLQKRFGKKSVRYTPQVYVYTMARKEKSIQALPRYILDGIHNYVTFALLRRKKIKPLFNVR